MTDKPYTSKIPVAIGLLSLALIAYELCLIQIFSFLQWYHFAYMMIAVALLGFGVAGTVLTLWENWLIKNYDQIFSALFFFTGMTMPLAIYLINLPAIRFDTYLIFSDPFQIIKLILTYLIVFVPFFFGALAIGLTFDKSINHIGKLYFFNLVGSGFGGLCFLILVAFFSPIQIINYLSGAAIAAGWLVTGKDAHKAVRSAGVISVLTVLFFYLFPIQLTTSQFKSISKALLLPDTKIYLEKNSPYGLIQILESPHLRYAPGLSLNYQQDVTVHDAIFINGDWYGAILPVDKEKEPLMDHATSGLPFYLYEPGKVLFLEGGTGEGLGQALYHQANDIYLVESNPAIIDLFLHELAGPSDSLFFHDELTIVNQDSRTYLLTDTTQFSLIVLPPVNTLGGSSGLHATQEKYLLTKDAFRDIWNRLLPDGCITITTWLDYPVRDPLKLLATFTDALFELNVKFPRNHIVAIKSWGTITFLIKRSVFSISDSEKIRAFCQQNLFDPVLLPELGPDERDFYNVLQDTQFYIYIEKILSPERMDFYHDYDFNIQPATDNRPYFYQNIRWKSLPKLVDLYSWQGLGFLEIGFLLIYLTLVQIAVIALVLILVPLIRKRLKKRNMFGTFLYFSGLGLGYLFIEIVLIQQFILYLGHAIYATTMVITILLTASGLGSYYSSKIKGNLPALKKWPLIIILIAIGYVFFLTQILQMTISASPMLKVMMVILLTALPGFYMGIPFPLGLSYLNKERKGSIPWAWGINGYFSVISSCLATIIAIELGFSQLLIMATAAYVLVLIAIYNWKRSLTS